MLAVEEVGDATELGGFADRWRLLASSGDLFQTPEWLTTWLASFWPDRRIAFLFVRDGGELVGLLPLVEDADGEVRCAGSLAAPLNLHAKRAELLCVGDRTAVLAAALEHLRSTRRRVRLCLRADRREEYSEPVRSAAARARLGLLAAPATDSPVIRVESDWETYLAARSKHVRKELGRKSRRLERAWRLERVTARTVDEADRAMTDVLRIERASWKHRAKTSLLAEAGVAGFYTALARRCAQRGWLRLEVLYLDGGPAAYVLGVEHAGELYALKTSFDEAFSHWSPGAVLFYRVLPTWFDSGVRVIDLLGTDARWKSELSNDSRCYEDVCLFSRGQLACEWCALRRYRVAPLAARGRAAWTGLRALRSRGAAGASSNGASRATGKGDRPLAGAPAHRA